MGCTEPATPVTQVSPGSCLERGRIHCECVNDVCLPSLDNLIRKSFKRLPTTPEWDRFRKYARRMRELVEFYTLDFPSVEVLSVLRLCIINEPLLPNLKTLDFWGVHGLFVPFVPFLLSPRTTSIHLRFSSGPPQAMVASMVTTFPKLCPNLQTISLHFLPRDPMITAAVSGMLLATNRNTLQKFHVDSPLTEEASEVIYKLPNLCGLSVVIERGTSLPPASLPNLTKIAIECEDEGDWPQLFRRATFGKLESVAFYPRCKKIGDFLETFEKVALSSSIQNTLSRFHAFTSCSWNPNYSSLLSFTQLVDLIVGFPCHDGCSSRVNDDIVIDLSRAMPKLRALRLGDDPCREFAIGATAKGLMALALHCPDLLYLCIHFQVASLGAPLASSEIGYNTEPTGSQKGCALKELTVGEIPVPEGSFFPVALPLLQIFPRIEAIHSTDEKWGKIMSTIRFSRRNIHLFA